MRWRRGRLYILFPVQDLGANSHFIRIFSAITQSPDHTGFSLHSFPSLVYLLMAMESIMIRRLSYALSPEQHL